MRSLLIGLFVFAGKVVFSQGIAGYVYDGDNQAVPSVRIQVKQFSELNTLTDIDGKYYIRLEPGVYDIVYSLIGYETQVIQVTVRTEDVVKNVWLTPENEKLEELIVKARRRDPAYEIIQSAIERKEKNQRSIERYSCDVYIKASAEIEKKEVVAEKSEEEKAQETFEEEKDETSNFAEIRLRLDFQAPDKTREERVGVKTYGNPGELFYTTTTDARFSLYDNLLFLKKVTETPLISPISTTAILSYKFKLDSIGWKDSRMIYKIRVTPRKKGNATLSGHVWIQDSSFAIIKADLALTGGSYRYDEFAFTQEYRNGDTTWLLAKQTFRYYTKNRKEKRSGYTVALFDNYNMNVQFPKRYFGNELGSTIQEAYERDSSYWDLIRPEPLSHVEQEFVRKRDSIYEVTNSKAYLDSVDRLFNKVTFPKVTYFGVDHRDRDKKVQWGVGSLWDMIDPFQIAGVRIGPSYYYFKKWENQKFIWSGGQIDMGLRNGDVKGNHRVSFLYDPFRLANVVVQFGHRFQIVNRYDAYLNYLKRVNYIENTYYYVSHQFEVFNGFYFINNFSLNDRKPIDKYKFGQLIDEIVDDNEPREFERYQNFKTEFTVQYVIGQQYLREPNRKVVLGSKGPTVYAFFEKGWNRFMWSDVDYEYLLFGIKQTFSLGTLGTSNYHMKSGRFIRQQDLRFEDLKFQRQSDPLLFSNSMYSFQILPQSYPTKEWYAEAHYVHHFNGALINFIPLVKKTRIQLVAGAGTLFLPEYDNFNYQELLVGAERVNKFLRRRLRLGIYYVMARYTNVPFAHTFKVSIELLNERNNTWNF